MSANIFSSNILQRMIFVTEYDEIKAVLCAQELDYSYAHAPSFSTYKYSNSLGILLSYTDI